MFELNLQLWLARARECTYAVTWRCIIADIPYRNCLETVIDTLQSNNMALCLESTQKTAAWWKLCVEKRSRFHAYQAANLFATTVRSDELL